MELVDLRSKIPKAYGGRYNYLYYFGFSLL